MALDEGKANKDVRKKGGKGCLNGHVKRGKGLIPELFSI